MAHSRADRLAVQADRAFLKSAAPPCARIDRQNVVATVSDAMASLVRPSGGTTRMHPDDDRAQDRRLPVHDAVAELRRAGLDAVTCDVIVPLPATARLFRHPRLRAGRTTATSSCQAS